MPAKKDELAREIDDELQKANEGRVHQVFSWILAGGCEHDIREAIAKEFHAEAAPLIVAAMQRIAKTADAEPDVVKGWAIEATRSIYQKALEVADFATALRAVKQLVEMSEI